MLHSKNEFLSHPFLKEIKDLRESKMGIPGFYAWLKRTYPFLISSFRQRLREKTLPILDILCLDLNGVIHESCQKHFGYGEFVPPLKPIPFYVQERRAIQEVWKTIKFLIDSFQPKEKVLIMVDGPAGKAKRQQQRARRYRSALASVMDEKEKFDPNSISPGTPFMDKLMAYLDQQIRKYLTEARNELEIIFSSDKVPGEGEHKLINFLRKYEKVDTEKRIMLVGKDADLIMLALSIQNSLTDRFGPSMHILREEELIDIDALRKELTNRLCWGLEASASSIIHDFIFFCFLLGNDFLPHSPTVDLMDDGLEVLFSAYLDVCHQAKSHLIVKKKIVSKVFISLLHILALNEEDALLKARLQPKFEDALFTKYYTQQEGKTSFNFLAYKQEYNTRFTSVHQGKTLLDACTPAQEYLKGMEWVFLYYTEGIPSWEWSYPYEYAPFASDLILAMEGYISCSFQLGKPLLPFHQLVTILPPQSKKLLPEEYQSLFSDMQTEVKIDRSGKRFDWQAIVLCPPLPANLDFVYNQLEKKYPYPRNRVEKERNYSFDSCFEETKKDLFSGPFQSKVRCRLL